MITDNNQKDREEKWHYIALKIVPTDDGFIRPTRCVSALLRKTTSNHNGDVYCLGCLQPYRTNNKLKTHERLCNRHDFCELIMSSEHKKVLKYNPGEKSLKVAHTFYLDLESLLVKTQSCQNNPKESFYILLHHTI